MIDWTSILRLPPIRSIEAFGAKPWDRHFDNGPIIQRALEESEGAVYVPGKTYYVASTIQTPHKAGGGLQGVGFAYHMREGAFTDHLNGGHVSRIVWLGEPGGTLVEYPGYGMGIDQVTLVGKPWWGGQEREQSREGRAGCLVRIIRGHPVQGVPTGKLNVGALSLCNADVGIWCDPAGGVNHTDHLVYQFLNFHDVDYCYRVTNRQSVHHVIQHCKVVGKTDVLFDFQSGGQLSVFDCALGNPATVLRTDFATANNGNYVIQNLKVDNGAKNWRLLFMDREANMRVRIGGHVGNRAVPEESVILGTPDIQTDLFNFENYPR